MLSKGIGKDVVLPAESKGTVSDGGVVSCYRAGDTSDKVASPEQAPPARRCPSSSSAKAVGIGEDTLAACG